MPEITESFITEHPLERVWQFFQNVPEVVTCMPGLALTEETGDMSYRGVVTVRVGPISATFEGEATIVETDAAAHRCRLDAKGIDKRGGNRAAASVTYELTPHGASGTEVTLRGEIKLAGALAQIGRGAIIHDVAHELTSQFVDCLNAKLAAAGEGEAGSIGSQELRGGRLLFVLFRQSLKRFLAGLLRPFRARP